MSNGGIIGPTNDPIPEANVSETITSFTSSGTFNPQVGTSSVDLIVIGGGGSGAGSSHNGGGCSGGGAGGLRQITSHSIPGSPVTIR